MAFKYNLIEFNTAVKPFLISHLFSLGYEKVLYLDPDILVCSRLDYALDKLDCHSVVVTPHQLCPEKLAENDKSPPKWEIAALMTGSFNLGFVGVSNTEEGRSFIGWWKARCLNYCTLDAASGLFVDQKWIDLAPCFFPGLHIVRHDGYNMSAWNLHSRKLSGRVVNEKFPLVFYHFSSIDMQNDDVISKHDLSLNFVLEKDLKVLFTDYKSKVKVNDWHKTKNTPYAYGFFADCNLIDGLCRRAYSKVEDNIDKPFELGRREFIKLVRNALKESDQDGLRKMTFVECIAVAFLKILYRVIGSDRYLRFVKYSERFSRVSNHVRLFS